MAEYYTSGINRKQKRRKRRSTKSLWMLLLDVLFYLFMIFMVVASLMAVIVQYISPAKVGVCSVVALVAPIIYLLDIAVLLYWVIRWRWVWVAVMAVVVFIGTLYAPRYYVADIMRDHTTKYVERHYTKILSYNIKCGPTPELVDRIKAIQPDIACFQEVLVNKESWLLLADKYNTTWSEGESNGCHIATRYRILRTGLIGSLPRKRGVWADLRIGDDTVRVVNLHLRSTSIRAEDTNFLENHKYILDNERKTKLGSIVARLTENNIARAEQAKEVEEFLKNTKTKVILCGDFNDVPLSYAYNTILGDLKDAFVEGGDGYAYTYNTAYRLLRIDNIFLSPEIEVVS